MNCRKPLLATALVVLVAGPRARDVSGAHGTGWRLTRLA